MICSIAAGRPFLKVPLHAGTSMEYRDAISWSKKFGADGI